MSADGLTEAEREQVALACDAMFDFGDTWIRFLRDGNETVLLPAVERILADRLAAVQAERDALRERVEAVEALADAYEAWDGSDPHSEFSSSPRQRAQLRAALDADRSTDPSAGSERA